METLNIKGMMKNRHLSKVMEKQCLYEIKRQMQYKCEFRRIEFIEADIWYPSSKTFNECGHIKPKFSLSVRTYICEECGCFISVVGVQALGMGLALVLSDAGGNAELARDGENGFVFPKWATWTGWRAH